MCIRGKIKRLTKAVRRLKIDSGFATYNMHWLQSGAAKAEIKN
jgi:hypothetical protein